MPKKARIFLTGGGSAGHIIPNLAVATALEAKQPSVELIYIASRASNDAAWLKSQSFKVHYIFVGKLRRYFSWRYFIDPLLVLLGFLQACFLLMRYRPRLVFSKGGYVSFPVALAAFFMRIPVILHESDARMGLANRFNARLAKLVCVSFQSMTKRSKFIFTGNPVRLSLQDGEVKKAQEKFGFNTQKPLLLIWGGSQGAKQINELLFTDFDRFMDHFQILHITGKGKLTDKEHPHYQAVEALDEADLKNAYAITDMIIGRAGANSLAEIALLQKPNILIPLGNADQKANALYFEENGAALIYQPGDNLFDLTQSLWQNESLRTSMKKALKKLSTPQAADKISDLILQHLS